MSTEPDYLAANRDHWNRNAHAWVDAGERHWASEATWGIWGIPNSEVPLLPEDMAGLDAIELGCGTGYGSAWMARRGAAVLGIDPTENQLATARRLESEHSLGITFELGFAEAVDRPDGSFDYALSEYGAAIWADPYAWIPEAHRLLRPGGRLAFLGHGSWVHPTTPFEQDGMAGDRLVNPYFDQHRLDWTAVEDDAGVEFNLPISEWFSLFNRTGFVVEDFHEIRAPDDAGGTRFFVPAGWARSYPSEQAWVLRKTA